MSYEKIGFENKPSNKTPISAENLNHMEKGIFEAHESTDFLERNLIVQKVDGEVATTTDSAKVKPKNIKLFGKGNQRQYEGNQLLQYPYTDTTINRNGIDFIDNGDGSISIKGTATSYTWFGLADVVLSAGTYTISGYEDNVNFIVQNKSDNTYLHDTFTLTEDTQLGVWVDIVVGVNIDITFSPMLNAGTEALPWEPYVGNAPSPSMNYPQKAVFLGESGSIRGNVYNKNLYSGRYYYIHYSNGIGYIDNTDDVVFPVVPTGETFGIGKIIPCRKGQTYTMSVNNPNENCTFGIAEYESIELAFETKNKIDIYGFGTHKNPIKYTAKQNGVLLCGVAGKWTDGSTTIHICTEDENVQVEFGDVATEYEAPATEQPFTSLTPNGLRGIPLGTTIPDAIKNSPIHLSGVYWDKEEGQYYIADTKNENGKDVQRIWRGVPNRPLSFDVTLDGHRHSLWMPSFFDCPNTGHFVLNGDVPAYSTFAIWTAWANGDNGTFCLSGDGIWFKESTKTLDELNTLFAEFGTDIEIYGVLAEPIITETSEQYDVVMNHPNTTIVNDAGAYMEVEYVCDPKKHIEQNYTSNEKHNALENRVAEIEKAMVNS